MLEQDGLRQDRATAAAIVVVRRTKSEIVDMIRAWAALESMAAAADHDHGAQKRIFPHCAIFFRNFGKGSPAAKTTSREYSKANIAFHQALISLSEFAGAGRYDQRYSVACARLPATHESGGRTAPQYRCPSTWQSSKRSKERNTELAEKSVHAIIRSALPPYVEAPRTRTL